MPRTMNRPGTPLPRRSAAVRCPFAPAAVALESPRAGARNATPVRASSDAHAARANVWTARRRIVVTRQLTVPTLATPGDGRNPSAPGVEFGYSRAKRRRKWRIE